MDSWPNPLVFGSQNCHGSGGVLARSRVQRLKDAKGISLATLAQAVTGQNYRKKPIKPRKLDKFMFSLFEFYDFYAMVQTFPNTLPACASLSTMNPMHRNHPLPMRIILVLVCSLKHRCARRATKPRPGCFWGATGSVWMRVRRL